MKNLFMILLKTVSKFWNFPVDMPKKMPALMESSNPSPRT